MKTSNNTHITQSMIINPYKLDHLVLNVSEKYQRDPLYVEQIREAALPYEPKRGKYTKGFRVSNLWIGKEYLEMVHVTSKDGGGWIKDWVSRYNSGHRGLICLFLHTTNMEHTVEGLRELGITTPQRLTFRFFFKLLSMTAKWRNAYLPFFEKVPMQLGFQQVDSEDFHKQMYKRMKPNSEINGITGIKAVECFGPFTDDDFARIQRTLIVTSPSPDHLVAELEHNQSLHFIKASRTHTRIMLHTTNQNSDYAKTLQIENVEIVL